MEDSIDVMLGEAFKMYHNDQAAFLEAVAMQMTGEEDIHG